MPPRQRREHRRQNHRRHGTPRNSLKGDFILDDAEVLILHPDGGVEDLAKEHLTPILLDPGLMGMGVPGAEEFQRDVGFLAAVLLGRRVGHLAQAEGVGAGEGGGVVGGVPGGGGLGFEGFDAGVGELFPGAQVPVFGHVEHEADAVAAGEEEGEADEPGEEGPEAPPAGLVG